MNYDPVPFDQTFILYDPNDIVSLACVHLSLLPVYIMVFYTSWFLITREIEPVIVVGGHLIGEIANKIIKRIVKQPRPDFHKDFGSGSFSLGYGMPLAHLQFLGFFAVYFCCIVLYRIRHLGKTARLVGCVALVTVPVMVASLRVYLLYHTWQQVAAGVFFGAILGFFYFLVAVVVRDIGLVDYILNWPIIRWFYVKDSYYHAYQTFQDEYDGYKQRIVDREGAKSKKVE